MLIACISYPLAYESLQMYQNGAIDYLTDLGNYVDIVYILGSVVMIFLNIFGSPFDLTSRLLMALVIVLAIRRTFNFLRIFEALSPIVTMLNKVIW